MQIRVQSIRADTVIDPREARIETGSLRSYLTVKSPFRSSQAAKHRCTDRVFDRDRLQKLDGPLRFPADPARCMLVPLALRYRFGGVPWEANEENGAGVSDPEHPLDSAIGPQTLHL